MSTSKKWTRASAIAAGAIAAGDAVELTATDACGGRFPGIEARDLYLSRWGPQALARLQAELGLRHRPKRWDGDDRGWWSHVFQTAEARDLGVTLDELHDPADWPEGAHDEEEDLWSLAPWTL